MQRLHAIVIATACCLLSASTSAFTPRPSSTLNLEFNLPDLAISVHLGSSAADTFPIIGSHLAGYLQSARETTAEIVCKMRHMA